jgi:hypothetical protein
MAHYHSERNNQGLNNRIPRRCDARGGPQELLCEALMIGFGMVVRHEVGDRVLSRGLSEEDHTVQGLGFHRAHEVFGASLPLRRICVPRQQSIDPSDGVSGRSLRQ